MKVSVNHRLRAKANLPIIRLVAECWLYKILVQSPAPSFHFRLGGGLPSPYCHDTLSYAIFLFLLRGGEELRECPLLLSDGFVCAMCRSRDISTRQTRCKVTLFFQIANSSLGIQAVFLTLGIEAMCQLVGLTAGMCYRNRSDPIRFPFFQGKC